MKVSDQFFTEPFFLVWRTFYNLKNVFSKVPWMLNVLLGNIKANKETLFLRVHISYGSHMFKDTSKARSNLNEQYKMKNVHIHTHMMMVSLPRSNIIIPANTIYVLAS